MSLASTTCPYEMNLPSSVEGERFMNVDSQVWKMKLPDWKDSANTFPLMATLTPSASRTGFPCCSATVVLLMTIGRGNPSAGEQEIVGTISAWKSPRGTTKPNAWRATALRMKSRVERVMFVCSTRVGAARSEEVRDEKHGEGRRGEMGRGEAGVESSLTDEVDILGRRVEL